MGCTLSDWLFGQVSDRMFEQMFEQMFTRSDSVYDMLKAGV